MVMHLVKEAFQKFANTVGLEPKPGSKDWWTQRAVMMEQELSAHEQQQEASLFTITSVNHKTDYARYRQALFQDVRRWTKYPSFISTLTNLNPWLARALNTVVTNSYDEKVGRKRKREEPTTRDIAGRREFTRGLQCEMVLSIMQRQRSQFNTPLLLVLKSMVALRTGLNDTYWRAESKCRLLMSYKWTHDFVLELSKEPVVPPFELATNASFFVYDNCDYHRKKAYDRTNDAADYIKTVNIAKVPVEKSLELSDTEIGNAVRPGATMGMPHEHTPYL